VCSTFSGCRPSGVASSLSPNSTILLLTMLQHSIVAGEVDRVGFRRLYWSTTSKRKADPQRHALSLTTINAYNNTTISSKRIFFSLPLLQYCDDVTKPYLSVPKQIEVSNNVCLMLDHCTHTSPRITSLGDDHMVLNNPHSTYLLGPEESYY